MDVTVKAPIFHNKDYFYATVTIPPDATVADLGSMLLSQAPRKWRDEMAKLDLFRLDTAITQSDLDGRGDSLPEYGDIPLDNWKKLSSYFKLENLDRNLIWLVGFKAGTQELTQLPGL